MRRIGLTVPTAHTGHTAVTAPIVREATAATAPILQEAIAATVLIHQAVTALTHPEVILLEVAN